MGSDGKSAVCCMCGDHGLLPELFRCAACSVRSQHTYCTDRYPKAEAYGTCNWCLRTGQSAATGAASPSSPSSSTVKPVAIRPAPAAHCSGSVPQPVNKVVAARGDFSAELNKPIKKQQRRRKLLLRRSASDLGSGRGVAGPPSSPGPGVVARGRPRVRRYKLLEEVIDQQLSFTI